VPAEVVGFRAGRTLLMALGDAAGIGPGARVSASGKPLRVEVSDDLLGRSLDGLGRPIDGLGPLPFAGARPVQASPPDPMERPRSPIASRSACARSTRSCPAAAASGSASSPAPASASPRCWA
jgi:flagellar biosynthesis/type III secretory pathway ATPase